MSATKIYDTAEINGEPVRCLLDSSCERSVIVVADLVSNAKLTPSQYSLFAANRASLDVLGDTVIPFVTDGHNFEADVSVSNKVKDFLLGSDWLEQQGAQWDFAHGTMTLGEKCITVHRRHRTGICRHIVVARDCVVPAKHEANVPMRMEDDGIPLPPGDWAIEPQALGPGVMATRTLFSDSQSQLVARVLNNSLKPKSLSANSLLSMAEPVQCLSGTSCKPDNLLLADSNAWCDSMLSDESVVPVLSSLQPAMVPTDGTELCESSVSAATSDATDPDSSTSPSGDQLDHIDGLLRSLPLDLIPDQRDRVENFIRSHANVFSRSEYDIGRTNIIPHRIDTGEHSIVDVSVGLLTHGHTLQYRTRWLFAVA